LSPADHVRLASLAYCATSVRTSIGYLGSTRAASKLWEELMRIAVLGYLDFEDVQVEAFVAQVCDDVVDAFA